MAATNATVAPVLRDRARPDVGEVDVLLVVIGRHLTIGT
jgi:hypothetical protein